MLKSRRTFLLGAAVLPFLGALPRLALAELSIGSGVLTTVSDGNLVLPGNLVFEPAPKDELAPILTEFGISRERLTPECNLALYRDGVNTVLFDVGAGPDFMSTAGAVLDSLDAAGVAPEDVTHVVFTHAHPDHIWGLLDDFDDLVFTNATYMMGRSEWDYWWNPDTIHSIGDARVPFAVGAKRRMDIIEDRVQLFDDGQEVLPGISAVLSPGHTPGHMSFEVRSGSDAALIVGDAIGNHHVAFRKPNWHSGSDQNPEIAAKTRRMLLDKLVKENLHLVGFHLPAGGLGRVETLGDGYRFLQDKA